MSYPINYPTPQNADVQIFYGSSSGVANDGSVTRDWVKPQGASFVWFTLIGTGGNGNGVDTGGGSAAVTNFMCPAFLIPDQLTVYAGESYNGSSSRIIYQQKDGAGYELLYATSASSTTGASAMSSNFFTAMGFFQSVAGQNGSTTTQSASSTTFLSGGANTTLTSNYGYSVPSNGSGFFQMSPIIVGAGGVSSRNGGIGCGGGFSGNGGNGLVVIITW